MIQKFQFSFSHILSPNLTHFVLNSPTKNGSSDFLKAAVK